VACDWVDVPLGRLEQYQRHIDPAAPPGDAGAETGDASMVQARRDPGYSDA